MEILTNKKIISMSECDHNAKFSYPAFFNNFMDIATKHGDIMHVGSPDLAKLGLFWVITKNRIKFYRRPEMMGEYNVSTWPIKPEILRSLRFVSFEDANGVFAEGKTEWIMLKKENFKPSKTTGVYPDGTIFSDKVILEEPWEKLTDDFSTFDREVIYKVKSIDIDLNKHMNNANYIRTLFSCFTTKELDEFDIKEIEIHYKSQCYEGDEISIRFKNTQNGFNVGFINNGNLAVTIKVITK